MERTLDPRDLEVFVTVAERGSFTAAARTLGTSQPAISTRIAALEGVLGIRLFDRGARRSRLTPAGEVLLPRARALLREHAGALLAVDRFLVDPTGTLHIGASSIPGSYLLPRVLGRLLEEFPHTRVQLAVRDTDESLAALRSGAVELVVVGRAVDDETLDTSEVGYDEIVPVACPELIRRQELDAVLGPDSLARVPLILREEGSATRRVTLEALAKPLRSLDVVLEMHGNDAIREAALAGIGVAFLSRLAVRTELESGRLVELRHAGRPIRRPLCMAVRKGRTLSPAAQALSRLLTG